MGGGLMADDAEGTRALYLYLGRYWDGKSLTHQFVEVTETEVHAASLGSGMHTWPSDRIRLYNDKGGVKRLYTRSPGVIYSVLKLNENQTRFDQPNPALHWPKPGDIARWEMQDKSASALARGSREIKGEVEDLLKRRLQPIREAYRDAGPAQKAQILARAVHMIIGGT